MRQVRARLEEILGEGGLLAKVVGRYDWRPQQLAMGRAALETLYGHRILLAEAPTGVGKTMAYLVPAALYARAHHEPVVVSSYSRTLQDQILEVEAPRLRRLIHPDLRIVALKGRRNYLCRRRWDLFVAEEGSGPDGRQIVDRLEHWVQATERGDFAEAPSLGRRAGWALARIGGEARFCRSPACRADRGCFHKLARREAREAHLIIVNHALLVADAVGGGVLPEHRALIVDEAHLLPEAALDQLSVRLSERDLIEKVRLMGGTGEPGVTDRLRRAARLLPSRVAGRDFAKRLRDLEEQTRRTLLTTRAFVRALRGAVRFPAPGERVRYGGDTVEDDWLPPETDPFLGAVARLMHEGRGLVEALGKEIAGGKAPAEVEGLREAADGQLTDLEEAVAALTELLQPTSRERVYCLEHSPSEGAVLAALPVDTGPPLREHILETHEGIVLTSATLATNGGCDYFARQVGLEEGEAEILQLESPFPLHEQLLTLIPTFAVDPRAPDYAASLAETIADLVGAVPRKALVLLTAHRTLLQVARGLAPRLQAAGVTLLAQQRGAVRAQLIERFRQAPRAVLLGTASFWHGVDFPGEELELLIVTRLPFPVPTDPRVAAIAEALEEGGTSSFEGYMLPEAVLRFRQGVGRLIRRPSDRGVCVILDPRVARARYGGAFRAVLPGKPQPVDSAQALRAAVSSWFASSSGGTPEATRGGS